MPSHSARRLRANLTDAEKRLWAYLRRRQIEGFRFRRQAPIGAFIVDFVCNSAKLIIEVDGGQHAEAQPQDAERTGWLEGRGFRVIRFWNNEVLSNMDGVLERIRDELLNVPPP